MTSSITNANYNMEGKNNQAENNFFSQPPSGFCAFSHSRETQIGKTHSQSPSQPRYRGKKIFQ